LVSGLSDNQFDAVVAGAYIVSQGGFPRHRPHHFDHFAGSKERERIKLLVSKREAASILGGLSVRTIENYINAQELVALRKAA
jgi:hypothetical protein